jgi:hypothetical protein
MIICIRSIGNVACSYFSLVAAANILEHARTCSVLTYGGHHLQGLLTRRDHDHLRPLRFLFSLRQALGPLACSVHVLCWKTCLHTPTYHLLPR